MKEIKQHYKNLIIGFGKGGKTLALYLAKQGEEVALVERSEEMYGGTCINVACIPTKSLITNAAKNIPYGDAWKIKNELTAFLREKNFNNLNDQPFITIINGTASFVSAREVKILPATAGATTTVSAERIFINTGTEPFIPNIAGVKNSARVFTSASLMEQPALPEKLIIIGGGFIGLEFADMYARFGTSVTVLDQAPIFLPGEDRDIADELYKILTEKEIGIRSGVAVQQITDTAEGVIVQYTTHNGNVNNLAASAVL
ncbi:MAG TPA: FAD-dependent oxidoreductase, partial [Cyclobacteriaceae bacterium]|nr:FAD-dependent oxidoreductase [Cyclobacteriaceae bacterium]